MKNLKKILLGAFVLLLTGSAMAENVIVKITALKKDGSTFSCTDERDGDKPPTIRCTEVTKSKK